MVIERKHRRSVAIALLFTMLALGLATSGCSKGNTSAHAQVDTADSVQTLNGTTNDLDPRTLPLVTFVELGSDRCIPCIKMREVMKEIQERYGDQVRIVFHDVWTPEGEPYVQQFGIQVIPTQVFLDTKGREYFRHEGYFPTTEVVKILNLKGVR